MTRSIYQFFARVETGEVIPNAEIKVPGHTIYDAATGGSAISQPLIATASGKVAFYIEPGIYGIEVKDPVSLATSNFADVEIGTARDKLLDNDSIDDIFSPDNIGRSAASTKTVLDNADAGNIGKNDAADIADFDLYKINGFFNTTYGANNEPSSSPWHVINSFAADGSGGVQIATSRTLDKMHFRRRTSNSFRPWNELYHTGNTGVAKLGIGTITPGAAHEVLIGDAGVFYQSNSNTTLTKTHMRYGNLNGWVGNISTSGTTTSFNTSSDPRLKDFKPSPTDEQINAKFNDLLSSFAVFNWKADPDGPLVWGFDAHKCIDNGLDMGSEGEGPRDSAIGDVYQEEETNEEGEVIKPELRVSPASIDQSKAVPILLAKIEQLERRLKELE